MAGFTWTAEEEIIAIWFSSVGVSKPVIARLLTEKGFSRTIVAVSQKIDAIRKVHDLGRASTELNLEYVDEWIHDRGRDLDLKGLLRPTLQDRQIINQDNLDLDILSHFSSRIDEPNKCGLFATDYIQHNSSKQSI